MIDNNKTQSERNVNFHSEKFFEIQEIVREWLSTEEAAKVLSLTTNALRIMVYRGQIQSYKFGRRLRFKLSDCLALMKKRGPNNGN